MNQLDIDLRIVDSSILVALYGPYPPDVYLNIHMMPIAHTADKERTTQLEVG